MPSNNNNKKANSSMSFSSSMSKQNWSMLTFIGLVIVVFGLYYFAYKSNQDTFVGTNNNTDTPPNLNVSKGETVVALFYADWCPHCVEFKPEYKKATSKLSGKTYKGKTLRFVMVDCDKYKSLSKENNVGGFPTVKILNDDGTSNEYKDDRSEEGLNAYFTN